MKNEANRQLEKGEFFKNSATFLKEFEPIYVEYLSSLCLSYDSAISKDEAKAIALSIYQNLFKCDININGVREDLLIKMRQDGVMIGFLISRSMFYLIENYIDFTKKRGIAPQVELLISCISRFINIIEGEVSTKLSASIGEFDVQFNQLPVVSHTIIETFQQIKDEGKRVQFLNLYQGVPISCSADIIAIEGESVTFKTERLQEIAMKLDGQAFIIKDDHFSKHIKADIVYSNFITNTVTLNNFIYLLNMPALQRESVRVHPNIVATVYLHQFGGCETSGRLYDLSMHGLGVLSSQNNGIFPGAKVFVSFDLSTAQEESADKIEVEAEVINIIQYKDSYRYCMRIFPDIQTSEKIVHYINQREKEIIQNLEDELKEYII
ncbi:MAG: PilZ domain-containing protein [Sulfurospirillum sp.]|jgi:hypothetical protein|nr:PilZ domain-containing protein [Sulfurospirillum sp.]MBP9613279.1 PilZ domain-containing protein [Sulfurospirillum sp.]